MNRIRAAALLGLTALLFPLMGVLPASAADSNLSPSATATASSVYGPGFEAWHVADGRVAHGAGNEWATAAGKAGSWVRLTWAQPVKVNKAVVNDRVNLTDGITTSRLAFSDGTDIGVGSLPNDGTAKTVTFTARTVTWVEYRITGVTSTTKNTGLAELGIWGSVVSTPTDQPPTVNAGPDQTITLPAKAQLQATVTDDMASAVVSSWSKVSGPGTVTFDDPTFMNAKATFGTAGTYVLRFTAKDSANPAVSDDVTVTVNPDSHTQLVVSAGPDRSVLRSSLPVTLDGTITDPGGQPTDQVWMQKSGPGTVTFESAYVVDPKITAVSAVGTYVLELTGSSPGGTAYSASDTMTLTVSDTTPPPSSKLPYTADSFFKSDTAGLPVDSALTTSFRNFMATNATQGPVNYPRVNLNAGWSGHNWIGTSADPVWKLVSGSGGNHPELDIASTQGVHLADKVWSTVPTGTQDRLLVVRDPLFGYTVQCADVVPNMAARTWTASSCGIMWHSSNGLDKRNPLSTDQRNFVSRGRIPDAMQVPRSDLDAAVAAGTGLGHVMHIFFVETNGLASPCFVHPMVGCEGDQRGWGAEGTRIGIDRSIDLKARGLTGAALAIAQTLQDNGGYLGDNSGSVTQLKVGPPEDYTGTNLATNVFSGKISWKDFVVYTPGSQ